MSWKPVVVFLAVLSLPALAGAQTEQEAQPPESQPVLPRTPQEALALIEQMLDAAKAAREHDRAEESRDLLLQAQRGLRALAEGGLRSPQATVLEGDLLTELGEYQEASERYKQVLAVDEFNFRANLGLGRYYVIARIWRNVDKYLQRARQVAPRERRAEVLRLLAVCHSGMGDAAEAVSYAEQAVNADPEDFQSLQLRARVRLEANQYEDAVDDAQALVATARRQYQAQPAERWLLQRLLAGQETLMATLRAYHQTLYRRDARGLPTDQLLPGNEEDAARLLSEMARVSEEYAGLRRVLASHDTLVLVERAVEYQPDNTRYLLDLAGLLLATNQTERAIETYQRILSLTTPSDDDPREAQRNQDAAREFLQRLGAPLTSQPAAETGPEP